MKRITDGDYGGSQSKRRLTSSRGESGGGRRGGGGGSANTDISSHELTADDALGYLKLLKETFQEKSKNNKYELFLQVMNDFKAQRINTGDLTARVKELFKGHNNLISGFNTFLPGGYVITLDEDETAPHEAVEYREAINLVKKIETRFQNDGNVYGSFTNILRMYKEGRKNINEVYNEVASLLEDHLDLLDEFVRFLPKHPVAPVPQSAEYDRTAALQQANLDENHQDQVVSHAERNHILDQPWRDDDNAMMKEIRDMRNDDQGDKRKSPPRIEGFGVDSNNSSYEEKDDLNNIYEQGFKFYEKVKEKLGSSDDYLEFLKCLFIYSTGKIEKNQLQNLVDDLLGKHPRLMEEFNKFFARCENFDGFLQIKVEDRDKEEKRDLDGGEDSDKYQGKSIRELDLPSCEDCSPSYRHLPDDYPISTPSYRRELGEVAEVLNDCLVSVTSGTEDYSFKHMQRNQYEESLFLCEDDRFELDMLLESVTCAAERVEEFLDMMNESEIEKGTLFNIEGHFTAPNLRCIERIYGDHGLEVIDILHKNPTLALPIILSRLKQKREEWTKRRADFNKVWAEIYRKNHSKSLDHRSFYFKQQDSRNLSTRSLVSEIKDLKGKKPEDGVLLAYAAGNWQPVVPHVHYEFTGTSIYEDVYKLVQYSCGILVRKEESYKIMRLWTTFLEPMLGIVSHCNATESSALDKKSLDHFRPSKMEKEEGEISPSCSDSEEDNERENEVEADVGLSSSEQFLHSVKPFSRHVLHGVPDGERKWSRKFYGNDDFFVLFRLYQTLYERILSAKTNSTCAEMEGCLSKDACSLNPYARFMSTLYNLLDGSVDRAVFEDECRSVAGNKSYMLFTLDKLIYKLVKQLHKVATDDVDSELLQLFKYENSRKPGKSIDSVYYDNARFLLHDENIYRFEFEYGPSRLTIQLLDNVTEKPEVAVDSEFAAYLQNDFLSMFSGKEPRGISLQRNKRKFSSLDDDSALSMAMEGVKTFNGLECKISCNSYKMSYVLDTEDFFIRPKKERRKLSHARFSNQDQVHARAERFHRIFSN